MGVNGLMDYFRGCRPAIRLLMWLLVCTLAAALLYAQPPVEQPRILGISHMAFDVSDLFKARAFYEDFLGFAEYGVLPGKDGSVRMVFIKVNDDQHLELFTDPPQADDGRLNHVAFYTDNAPQMRDYLASRGVKVPERVGKGKTGDLNFEFKDPDGHTIEIVQYEPTGWVMRDRGKLMPPSRISPRIGHAGLSVGALQDSMNFYGGILGFREFWRGNAKESETLSWVNMRVPDGQDYVEFMLYAVRPSPDRLSVMHHFSLEVPDVHQAVAELESRPAFKTYGRNISAKVGVNHRWQANLFDPDGTRIELMEPGTFDGKPVPPSTAPPPHPAGAPVHQ